MHEFGYNIGTKVQKKYKRLIKNIKELSLSLIKYTKKTETKTTITLR